MFCFYSISDSGVWVVQVVNGGRKKVELLPGDRDNLAVQTRGGPEKHEVTGWVLISPLTQAEQGAYECRASNSQGEATAVGAIHLVNSLDDIPVKRGEVTISFF
ncbi:hypothetical protein NQD34_003884 [Periophthalmus magnuspinnatus]|nr:hypothetical protein NQD34_003884 [Periophthalmus magnuspinnatus]